MSSRSLSSVVLAPAVVITIALAPGCDVGPAGPEAAEPDAAVVSAAGGAAAAGVTGSVAVLATLDPALGEFPEGVAVGMDGHVYFSVTPLGEIRRLRGGSGPAEAWVAIPLEAGDLGVLGLAFDAHRTLHAAVVSGSPGIHGVWRIDAAGQASHIPGTEVMAFPNGLTFDRRGNLYVTDSALGAVWRLSSGGELELWAQTALLVGTGDFGLGVPIGANGILFQPGRSGGGGAAGGQAGRLLVANTEVGRLVEIAVRPDGSAGGAATVAEGGALVGLDGIAADQQGRVFGAVNVQDAIVMITPDGVVSPVATDGLDFPASLAFGTRGGDQHALFITNFALANEVDPSPGIVRLDVGPPGRR
jgi:streptogramin lyase